MTSLEFLVDFITWHCTHAHKRTAKKLSPKWFDDLLRVWRTVVALEEQRQIPGTDPRRLAFAIWGPSQAGKSTFFASVIDGKANERGEGSALHWPDGMPARFVWARGLAPDVLILNPYEGRADATACVTRFVQRERVPFPAFPIQIHLASPAEVRLSLAAGYQSQWNEDDVGALNEAELLRLVAEIRGGAGALTADLKTVCILEEFVGTLDILVKSGFTRYQGLRRDWNEIRQKLVNDRLLQGRPDLVEKLALKVFWNAEAAISDAWEMAKSLLAIKQKDWRDPATKKMREVFCSLPFAAMLLDIRSFVRMVGGQAAGAHVNAEHATEQSRTLRARVAGTRWAEIDGRIVIGCDDEGDLHVENARALFSGAADGQDLAFGYFQAVVRELTIPLRKDAVHDQARPEAASCFETHDILDFPGIDQGYGDADDARLTRERVTDWDLFARILKRGKTASILMGYARSQDLDGFLLFARAGLDIAHPPLLNAGIGLAWTYANPDYRRPTFQTRAGRQSPGDGGQHVARPPLPIYLVQTFFSYVLKNFNRLPDGKTWPSMRPALERLDPLASMGDPRIVLTLCSNYPKLPDGVYEEDEEILRAKERAILKDDWFRDQYRTPESQKCFTTMVDDQAKFNRGESTDDCAVRCIFDLLAQRAADTQAERTVRTEGLRTWVKSEVERLIHEVLPKENPIATFLSELPKQIMTHIKGAAPNEQAPQMLDAVYAVGVWIRSLLTVDAEKMDPLPQQHLVGRYQEYLRSEFQRWERRDIGPCPFRALQDPAALRDLRHYMWEKLDLEALGQWIFNHVSATLDRREARTIAAILMSDVLLMRGPHREPADLVAELEVVAAAHKQARTVGGVTYDPMDLALSAPFWTGIIRPFGKHLAALAQEYSDLIEQDGDREMRVYKASFESGEIDW